MSFLQLQGVIFFFLLFIIKIIKTSRNPDNLVTTGNLNLYPT